MTLPRSPITTHVLDTSRGCPAAGVPVSIEFERGGSWEKLGGTVTNEDGRVPTLLAGRTLEAGRYRVSFNTNAYFSEHKTPAFYPYVQIVFEVCDLEQHYHIPLLLSPFGYSTYRGS